MFIVPITQMNPVTSISEAQKQQDLQAGGSSQVPFADVLKGAVENYREMQKASQQDSYQIATGTVEDLAMSMINSQKTATALEFTVRLTSQAVTAYKEIMQTQV